MDYESRTDYEMANGNAHAMLCRRLVGFAPPVAPWLGEFDCEIIANAAMLDVDQNARRQLADRAGQRLNGTLNKAARKLLELDARAFETLRRIFDAEWLKAGYEIKTRMAVD